VCSAFFWMRQIEMIMATDLIYNRTSSEYSPAPLLLV